MMFVICYFIATLPLANYIICRVKYAYSLKWILLLIALWATHDIAYHLRNEEVMEWVSGIIFVLTIAKIFQIVMRSNEEMSAKYAWYWYNKDLWYKEKY